MADESLFDLRQDGFGVLGSRVVAGYDDQIAVERRGARHQWALLTIATLDFCLYFGFVWKHHGVMRSLARFNKPVLAAGLGGFSFYLLKAAPLALNLVISAFLYLFLIVRLKVISTGEVEIFRGLVQTGFRWKGHDVAMKRPGRKAENGLEMSGREKTS